MLKTLEKVYIKQEDGSLKPVEHPAEIAKRLACYLWLKENDLSLEEITFLSQGDAEPLARRV